MVECPCCGEQSTMYETHKLVENVTEGDEELVWRLAAFCDECWDDFVKPTLRWLTGGTEWLNEPRDDQKVFDTPTHGEAFTSVEPLSSDTRHVARTTEYGPHTGWRVLAVTECGMVFMRDGHGVVSLPDDYHNHGIARIGGRNSHLSPDDDCTRCRQRRPEVFASGSTFTTGGDA